MILNSLCKVKWFLFTSLLFVSSLKNPRVSATGCSLDKRLIGEIQSYSYVVNKIINATTNGNFKGGTYKELEKLVDKFGARFTGTENLENAIDYILDVMQSYNIENVHGENVTVPSWIRGNEYAEMIKPRKTNISILSLGSSVATPDEGVEAEVLVVKSFDELNQPNNSKTAKGKIVIFNQDWETYGEGSEYRTQGASEASKHGAVATLIRSVTPFSMATIHTGAQKYSDDIPQKIPTACITVEDAHMFQRLQDKDEKIVIKLYIKTETLPDSISRNSVGEIVGKTKPENVVLVSGHFDSWDVGVGAMDDGGGAFISWYSLAVLKALGLRPRRTIRAVLWTAEEVGLVGAYSYNSSHYEEIKENFTFIMESDSGTFTPQGIEYSGGEQGRCILEEIAKLLLAINTTQILNTDSSVGSDISIWTGTSGIVPGGSLLNANERYFWFHHTAADTMDVLNSEDLDKATALWASVAYIIADISIDFNKEAYSSNSASNFVTLRCSFVSIFVIILLFLSLKTA